MLSYSSYFDRFPKLDYKMSGPLSLNKDTENLTNIFFRVAYIREVLSNVSSYYMAEIQDGDTPEILADKVYDDPGADWMIILANQILDPQFDWPLNYDAFNAYVANKYGSVDNAQITTHHYEMVITRTLQPDNVTTEHRYIVNGEKLTDNNLDVPYNYYQIKGTDPGSLANTQEVNTYNILGKTITEVIRGVAISNYDYELEANDQKRLIKIIKKEYYTKIQSEFNKLTDFSSTYRRRVV